MNKKQDLFTGIFKFDDAKVSKQELADFGEELAKDDNFIMLYVRKASKDQLGLGFSYIYDGGKQESFADKSEEFKDMLYKKFGTAFVGWDLSSSTIVIKGFPEKVLDIE